MKVLHEITRKPDLFPSKQKLTGKKKPKIGSDLYQEFRKLLGKALIEIVKPDDIKDMIWFDEYDLIFQHLVSGSTKGMLFQGGIGCSKTVTMMALRRIKAIRCKEVMCQQVGLEVAARGADAIVEYSEARTGHLPSVRDNHYFFDDIGTEKQANHFGTLYDPMPEILFLRNAHYNRCGTKTYGTTNLSFDALTKRYDARISDRMREMFHVITFKSNKSLRR